jgi:cytochrome c biogenesis protein CcmG/thiol:disulfide interchange protein DsbE
MHAWRTPTAVGVLLVALVVAAAVGALSRSSDEKRLTLPSAALAGAAVTVDDLRGRPAVVHYWASWCVPCVREAPEIARLPARLGDRARLVGVDWSDDRSRARAFLRRHGWRFSVLEDPRSTSGTGNGLVGLPMTLIVDAHGRIVRRMFGPQTVAAVLAVLPS